MVRKYGRLRVLATTGSDWKRHSLPASPIRQLRLTMQACLGGHLEVAVWLRSQGVRLSSADASAAQGLIPLPATCFYPPPHILHPNTGRRWVLIPLPGGAGAHAAVRELPERRRRVVLGAAHAAASRAAEALGSLSASSAI